MTSYAKKGLYYLLNTAKNILVIISIAWNCSKVFINMNQMFSIPQRKLTLLFYKFYHIVFSLHQENSLVTFTYKKS
jgi:hypothetical protein